jgi:Cys-tRNA(Pro)/Cys-tRNA(Cys) deacylase
MQFLKKQGIPFRVLEYEHHEKGAAFASEAIGIPLEKTIKTLVTELTPKGYLVLLMPGHKNVSFKKLARARGVKKAAMVSSSMAERLTGYKVGGISPFGMKRRIPVLIEKSLLAFDKVAINGGRRGVMLVIASREIVKVLGAEPIDL